MARIAERIYTDQQDIARLEATIRSGLESLSLRTGRTPLGKALPGRIGMEIRATVEGGLRILEKIEAAGYDVFRRRPVLKPLDWPLVLARAV